MLGGMIVVAFPYISKEEGKDQESIHSSTIPEPGWKSDKNTRKHYIQESQVVSPFPTYDHNAARNKLHGMANTNTK